MAASTGETTHDRKMTVMPCTHIADVMIQCSQGCRVLNSELEAIILEQRLRLSTPRYRMELLMVASSLEMIHERKMTVMPYTQMLVFMVLNSVGRRCSHRCTPKEA